MAELKMTKTELRLQQVRLTQLQKYLPTLQLKKAMLQIEVHNARLEISQLQDELHRLHRDLEAYSALLSDQTAFNPAEAIKVTRIEKRYENIAGVDVPYFDTVVFEPYPYSLFDTPAWVDPVTQGLRKTVEGQAKIIVVKEKKRALEKELREVSIRVNLFEKILIPRAFKNIKRIKVFLGDQQLAAVSQAKVAKGKINKRGGLIMEPAYAY